ncbi:MAG: hypothetical protein ACRDIE_18425, partial [Chloroflexota bacterium]
FGIIIIFLAGNLTTAGAWVGEATYASEKAGSNPSLPPGYTKMMTAPAPLCRAGQQAIPRPCGSLAGVAAISGSDLWVVGTNFNTGASPLPAPLIEHWDGKIWHIVTPPKSVGDLAAVAVVSATDVWAVGRTYGAEGVYRTLILHYNGRRWSVVPNPVTAGISFLSAVAASSSDDVWTAGMETNAHQESQAVVEHWDGRRGSIVPSPKTNE